jgi:hypothetical protein
MKTMLIIKLTWCNGQCFIYEEYFAVQQRCSMPSIAQFIPFDVPSVAQRAHGGQLSIPSPGTCKIAMQN